MIEPLLKAGANPNIQDGMGLTPLMIYDSPSIEICQRLIEAGADLNLKSLGGNTILHFMAGGGHIQIVRLLMENGANINAINDHDETPVSIALERGHHNVVDLINYYNYKGVYNEVNYIR
jgi:ankyrin repeat protein